MQKLTFWVYLIGALALAGIFPLAGFWSKDEILVEALELQPTVFWLLLAAAFCTAFYMGRQIWMVFFGTPRSEAAAHARENPPIMTIPLVILPFLSIVGGWLNLPSTQTFSTWLEHTISGTHVVEEGAAEVEAAAAGGVNWFVILLTSALALGAIALSWYLYQRRYQEQQNLPLSKRPDDPLRAILGPVFTLLANKYYVDELYNLVMLGP